MKRTAIPKKTRLAVLHEAGYRCAVPTCKTILVDIHHMMEVAKGGGNTLDNLIALCPTCHALYHRGTIKQISIRAWKERIQKLNELPNIAQISGIIREQVDDALKKQQRSPVETESISSDSPPRRAESISPMPAMYVISSRSRWLSSGGSWTVLQTGNALPPTTAPQSNYLPSGFINLLQDPLVILVHGFGNPEATTFKQYASEIGTSGSVGLLAANGFTGSVIGYDWPSFETPASGSLQQYVGDLKAATNIGAPSLADFLTRLSTALAGRDIRINLMAHSMGNLVVRQTLLDNPRLAGVLDNIISFAPDLPQSDLERPELIAAADTLTGNWFVYWAQADFVLLTLSNLANIILGNEQWGGQRVGQEGLRAGATISKRVIAQNWDPPLSKDLGSTYNSDLREWPFSAKIHSYYWTDKPFLTNIAQNLQRPPSSPPIIVKWPLP